MNFFKKAKRTGILSLICVVLFMYIGSDYMSASEVGTYTENVMNEKTDSLATAEGRTGIGAGVSIEAGVENGEGKAGIDMDDEPDIETGTLVEEGTGSASEPGMEGTTGSKAGFDMGSAIGTEAESGMEGVPDSASGPGMEGTTGSETGSDMEAETGPKTESGMENESDMEAARGPEAESGMKCEAGTEAGSGMKCEAGTEAGSGMQGEIDQYNGSETDGEAETEDKSEAEEESETDTTLLFQEYWQDCLMVRAGGGKGRSVASAEGHRDDSLVLAYLDFPCYFKYVTNHGMETGGKTLVAYCVYNPLEGPDGVPYIPQESGAFSKEITYCLYNGCRYRGSTSYNSAYSTGDWKKDYYITQIAIHIINNQQGRESSIMGSVNKSKDTQVYNLINKMVKDAYADSTISSTTNQTKQVTYQITPVSQGEWIRQSDGTWRTAKDYVCASNHGERVVSVSRVLSSNAPEGITVQENQSGNVLSSFYLKATDAAYRKAAKDNIPLTVTVNVVTQEYGGWWYVPANGGSRWQYITFLSEGMSLMENQPQVTASVPIQYCEIMLEKSDNQTKAALSGAVYGLYADQSCTVLVKQFPATDTKGKSSVEIQLGEQEQYYIQEIVPPNGYLPDHTVHPVSVSDQSEIHLALTDTIQKGTILLHKKDKETGQSSPQGDGSLEGALYGLYAKTAILHPDGKTGVLYEKDAQISLLKTDAQGKAKAENLYLGQYYLKEIEPPKGYVKDEICHDISLTYEKDSDTVVREIEVAEQVMKQGFQLIKGSSGGGDTPAGLGGAGFSAWLLSDLEVDLDGRYKTEQSDPAPLGKEGEREIFTDENGCLSTIPLPYGIYLVRETTVPANHKPVKDFFVTISKHSPDVPQPWKILMDDAFQVRLKITKRDKKSGKDVLLSGAEFKVLNLDTGEAVEQTTSYPENKKHTTYFTNEEGYLLLPKELPAGNYGIIEVTAPEGYTLNEEMIRVTLDENSLCQVDTETGDLVYEAVCFDEAVTGKIEIIKTGDIPIGFQDGFIYSKSPLSGVAFEVLSEDGIMIEAVTDEDGHAVVEDLPLGTYRIREKVAPFGFLKDEEGMVITLSYQDQYTPVVTGEIEIENIRQKLKIQLYKTDYETGDPVENAEFALYAKEDIKNMDGTCIVKAGTQIGTCKTDAEGNGEFMEDIPHGLYIVREEKVPFGYVEKEEKREQEADLRTCDFQTPVVEKKLNFSNVSTLVEISKTDMTDGAEIPGAKLEVRDEQGNLIEQWISGKEPHRIRALERGKTYTLTELTAPRGYVNAETVSFTVENTGEIQKVEMKDDHASGILIIKKTDSHTGEPLENAVFELKTSTGELLETLTTDKEGIAQSDLYEIGLFEDGVFQEEFSYILQEKKAPYGYEKEEKEYKIVFAYEGGDTPVTEVVKEIKNSKAPSEAGTDSPKTGDPMDPEVAAALLLASGGIFTGAYRRYRKKKYKRKAFRI